jgi:hypothetical protein
MDLINARRVPDAPAGLTPGAAVAGMIVNSLGLAHRPRSVTPPCFANTPLEWWCRDGLRADRFHRLTRGRTRAEADASGGDRRVQERALAVWAHAGLDRRVKHRDPTSVALRGEASPARDEPASRLTHGDAPAHRPAVQPAGWERMGSHEGGVPYVSQRGEGQTADTQRFQARAQTGRRAFKTAPRPRSLRADATRDPEDHAAHRRGRGFSTRLANTLGVVSHPSAPARTRDTWPAVDATPREQGVERGHAGRAQRGRVVDAPAALARAAATITHATPRDDTALDTPLWHGPATRVATPAAAQAALARCAPGWPSPPRASFTRSAHHRSAGNGRPPPSPPGQDPPWPLAAHVRPAEDAMGHQKPHQACGGLGTTIGGSAWSETAVMAADKRQSRRAGGVRVRQDPRCVVSSWCVKKPCRIYGRLMVMTCAWWVDSGGTTPPAPAMGTPPGNGAAPQQPPDRGADGPVDCPAVERYAPRPADPPRSGPSAHRRTQRPPDTRPAPVWSRGLLPVSQVARRGLLNVSRGQSVQCLLAQ